VTLQAAAAGYTTQSVPVTIIVNPAAKLPTATTSAASAVTASTTTLNATVNPNGADTKVWFLYGTSSTLSGASQTASLDLGSGRSALAIAVKLTGLKAKQLYHYQVVAQNSAGTVKGAIKSFTTLVQLLPSVATTPATAVKSTTATINGTVNANGADTHTWFLLSTNKSMSKASKSGSLDVGSSSSLYSIQCPYTGLSASTTYYYEIVAQNSAGTSTGAVKSFTTTASSKKSNEPAAALTAGKISRAE
jgi:phosphodiesterase/alkaline phosphatase D-like protein